MHTYNFNQSPVNLDRLKKEIQDSAIVTSLNSLSFIAPSSLAVTMNAELSVNDETILQLLVETHSGEPLPEYSVTEVVTQLEKNDKVLRSFCAFADTDANGVAEFAIPVPAGGRHIAYGDAEFAVRHFKDRISVIEISDLDRRIAWREALNIDPNASEPLPDSVIQENGFPLYPVLGHYDERGFPATMPANAKGEIHGGMAMSFQFAITEAQPIGGYGFLPEGFFLVVKLQKAPGQGAGHSAQLSIDWAEKVSQ